MPRSVRSSSSSRRTRASQNPIASSISRSSRHRNESVARFQSTDHAEPSSVPENSVATLPSTTEQSYSATTDPPSTQPSGTETDFYQSLILTIETLEMDLSIVNNETNTITHVSSEMKQLEISAPLLAAAQSEDFDQPTTSRAAVLRLQRDALAECASIELPEQISTTKSLQFNASLGQQLSAAALSSLKMFNYGASAQEMPSISKASIKSEHISLQDSGTSISTCTYKRKREELQNDEIICPICSMPWEISGPHRVSALQCGHVYGYCCLLGIAREKRISCPECQELSPLKEIRFLYPNRIIKILDPEKRHTLYVQLKNKRRRLIERLEQQRLEEEHQVQERLALVAAEREQKEIKLIILTLISAAVGIVQALFLRLF